MSVFLYAWRNLWRNKRRTLITLLAITLNTGILIATYSLMNGFLHHMIKNATNLTVGEAQIHAEDYLKDRSLYKIIPDPEGILSELSKEQIPASPRLYGYGLVARDTKSAGAFFWGVDPELEMAGFDLLTHIQPGASGNIFPDKGMILGRKLAKSLQAKVGSEIVVVVQAADGSLGNELFYVSGILKAAGDSIDRGAAILHEKDFRELFVMPTGVHEIAVNSRGIRILDVLSAELKNLAASFEVKTWRELVPALSDMMNMMEPMILIFGLIFFLAAGLGVLNTMLMATMERVREFGIIKALGATPWRLLGDVMAEAFSLVFLATLLGTLIGIPLAWYLQVHGLDTSSFAETITISGIAFDPIWRAVLSVKSVVGPVVVMWIVCLLASLYPAIVVMRLDPVKAIHRT